MTRLNVEPAAPSVRPPEPASSSTATRGGNDLLTVFDTHLRRAQTPEPTDKLRPNAPDFDEPAGSSAEPNRPKNPNEPVGAQRNDRRRDEINARDENNESDEHDERHDDSIQPANSEQQVVTTAESSGNERHEEPSETTVDAAQHDTEDAVQTQVVIDEAATGDDVSAQTAHPGAPSGDRTHSTENEGNESHGDESGGEASSAEENRGGRPRISYGNDALTGKDATTEEPVSFDEIAPIANETDAETDAETPQRDDNGNNRQGRRANGVAQQARRNTRQSRSSDRAGTESPDTADRHRDAETSAETAKSSPDVGTPQPGRTRRPNATHPNPQYGPEPPAFSETQAVNATSPAARSALAAAAQAFTRDESGQQLAADSASQAADEAAAAGGDNASEGRARGNPQDGRADLPPQLRAQFGSRSSGEPAHGDGLSSVQRARFVQRVGNAFRMASERGGVVRLRLSPVELGSLRLEIVMRDGMMTARMEVETSQARSTIVDNLGMLRQRLAEHNVEIERFDVEVREHGAGETPEQNDRSTAFGNNRQNNNARGNNTDGNDTAQDSQEPRMARRPDDDSQLNLVI